MAIHSQDVKDIAIWILSILYLFALGYIGSGGQSILIILFASSFSTCCRGNSTKFVVNPLRNIIGTKEIHGNIKIKG